MINSLPKSDVRTSSCLPENSVQKDKEERGKRNLIKFFILMFTAIHLILKRVAEAQPVSLNIRYCKYKQACGHFWRS